AESPHRRTELAPAKLGPSEIAHRVGQRIYLAGRARGVVQRPDNGAGTPEPANSPRLGDSLILLHLGGQGVRDPDEVAGRHGAEAGPFLALRPTPRLGPW